MGNIGLELDVNDKLPGMGANPNNAIVAGFSSGAFMAHNLHMVYSDTFKGAGLVSGGSYHAESYYPLAGLYTGDCNPYVRDPDYLAEKGTQDAIDNSNSNLIDNVSNLKNQPVFIQQN